MQLKYKDKTTFVRTFDDNVFWPEEEQVAAAFKRLVQLKMPQVMFLTGDLERNIYKTGEREFSFHSTFKGSRAALINVGFDEDTLSLDARDIPDDIATLVLADPKTQLSATSLSKIRQYIDKGGNMLLLGEPGKQQMLNPVLQQLGVQLNEGTLVQLSKNEMPHMVVSYATMASTYLADETQLLIKKKKGTSLFYVTPGAAPIVYDSSSHFKRTAVLATAPDKVWLKTGNLVTDSAAPVFSPQEGDFKLDSFVTAVALTRQVNNKEQRIVVCGDADFMSNLRSGGAFISRSYYSWMDYNQFPIYTPRPTPKDDLFTISPEGANMLKIVYVWVLPGIVLLLGTILLIRRKRQ